MAWEPTGCLTTGSTGTGAPYEGRWTAEYPPASGQIQPEAFRVGTKDGTKAAPVSAIQVFSASIRTASGVGLASTDAEIRAAYPNVSTTNGTTSTIYSVHGSGGDRMDLEVAHPDQDTGGATGVILITVTDGGFPPSSLYAGDGSVDCGG